MTRASYAKALAQRNALLGRVLFTDYMFPFEVTSILILASMVGAVILARKQGE